MLTFYEKPIEENGLLPPTARTVVFGNGSIAKLLALSQRISEFPRNKPAGERIAAYRGYLAVAREYLADQIASRSLGHVPLQSYLQASAIARCIDLLTRFFVVLSFSRIPSFASLPLAR